MAGESRPAKIRRLVGWKEWANCDFGGGPRKSASETVVTALFSAGGSPLAAPLPYHAFARSPPTPSFGRPAQWPGPAASGTKARLLWDRTALYVCWELEGEARPPADEAAVEVPALAAWADEIGLKGIQREQLTIPLDERVECFLWQPEGSVDGALAADSTYQGQHYHAFEINYSGKALTLRPSFGNVSGFDWDSKKAFSTWSQELPVGLGASASPVPGAANAGEQLRKRVVIAAFYWEALGIDISREIRIGMHRAESPGRPAFSPERKAGKAEFSAISSGMVWSSCVEPGDAVVNFHRPSMFAKLALAPEGADIDCSCGAVRWRSRRELAVVRSPLPSLDDCPPGSLLVQAKYASLCGSDLPYFRDKRAPSCYWDRDGFCGHEVVGVVLASKSERFQPGDAVLALPSGYFKAHAGSKQDWFKEDVHGVLLQNLPVRGGFSEVYTSHELYSCRIRECVPRMLLAQGLGTLLKMVRKMGSVLGKSVVVLGQGQNGLMSTRLMAQMCAAHVIVVDPLEYRRELGLKFGATAAASPSEAPKLVDELTGGRGVDIVLEMVGHCQNSVNEALRLVACGGSVYAFGVPDDAVYDTFEFSLFFRKNVSLIASVIPDPQVDFPLAARLIEQGRFCTEGMLTHTLGLSEMQRAFEISSDYLDNVVKLVIDFSKK